MRSEWMGSRVYCWRDEGLDALWKLQVAPKLQMCYQHEKNAEICDTYERMASAILEAGKDGEAAEDAMRWAL